MFSARHLLLEYILLRLRYVHIESCQVEGTIETERPTLTSLENPRSKVHPT